MLITAGHSSDGKNVAFWDTLLPQKRAQVQSFVCHESGASSLLLANQQSLLVTAGKKGQVAIWDVRQNKQLHMFRAHDQAIKCMALDPNEEFFVTGSAAGDIKVTTDFSFCQQTWGDYSLRVFFCQAPLMISLAIEMIVPCSQVGLFLFQIWSLTSYRCCFTFSDEHTRHGIFKNISQGVSQVFVDQCNRLFSCGADGTMKVRQLPDRDLIVNSI